MKKDVHPELCSSRVLNDLRIASITYFMDKTSQRQQQLWASALTLTSLYAQITTVVMATAPTTRGPMAQWNKAETKALMAYFLQHKSEIGEGGMFKMGTFNAAATEITKHHTSGPVKTGKKCKTKWQTVITQLIKSFFHH